MIYHWATREHHQLESWKVSDRRIEIGTLHLHLKNIPEPRLWQTLDRLFWVFMCIYSICMCGYMPVWVHMHDMACISHDVCWGVGCQRTTSDAIWDRVFLSSVCQSSCLRCFWRVSCLFQSCRSTGVADAPTTPAISVGKLLEDSSLTLTGRHSIHCAISPAQ